MKQRIKDFFVEWMARRDGRAGMGPSDLSRTVRDGVGIVGNAHSRSWDVAADSSKRYTDSFDPRIPPSIHISERDRLRANRPIPVSERCIEDWPRQEKPAEEPQIDLSE